jgi:excisionase family DNA binding protein
VPHLAMSAAAAAINLSSPAPSIKPKVIVMFVSKTLAKKDAAPLASISEVANYLNVSSITVRRRIRNGELPATKIGGQIRIKWSDVDALVAHSSVLPAA